MCRPQFLVPTLFSLALVVLCFDGIALANDEAAAEATFQRGKEHMAAGRTAEACADFALSEKLDSSVGTLLNLGECRDKLGETASAWAAFQKAAALAERGRQARRREYARKRASEIASRLTQIELRLESEAPEGLVVTRNGEEVTLLVGTAVPVDPGTFSLKATAPGYKPWEKSVEVNGEGQTITVVVPALAKDDSEKSVPVPQGEAVSAVDISAGELGRGGSAKPNSTRRYVGLGIGGVGAASVATGLVFGTIALVKHKKVKIECPAGACADETGVELNKAAKRAANTSSVLVGVGGAALLAGAIIWWTAPRGSTSEKRSLSWQATPSAGPSHLGLTISGGF